MTDLAGFTTFHLGGPAGNLRIAGTRDELVEFCREHPLSLSARADADVLFIGGGSNLLISDTGFDADVCVVATTGVTMTETSDVETRVTAEAGEDWDEFVAFTLGCGLSGLEALSGIPGSVGATPIQNVGAYGTEVAELITSVEVFDRLAGQVRHLSAVELEFGYRTSALKRAQQRTGAAQYLVLSVTFDLQRSSESLPVRYAQLASALDVEIGDTVPASLVRTSVIFLRRSKGMVLDVDDHDTWSAGSFFTNPILDDPAKLPDEAPRYPVTDPLSGATLEGRTKTSAAWLIEHAGFTKGFRIGEGRASLSTKHTLALTNRGQAATEDVLELARTVVDGVKERFGIALEPEPTFIACSL
ncbi:MAG: UDP-N-acetylmuramate dehydrogenase [Brevibacterium sp.]|uniref:UDP-N-acetylmuramate dehydrogenase n=1 Tax=Brevibacterium sp. TaxID=1701 RepID=UPI002649DE90|nr:UDP-N-acetylmuramate dehydrogenase [Brevibacterium sp.]MDN5808363.1 UDP-N-acetylmuramate dehydrogenase [Brevibacterium sp.]MDN5834086.1 UDP-N-acetylmuramate dehydrogenase [Brevibacterium sp.]MDN5877516.1 UDP-N-acetylmuramate dehydrogenase [Brevibacterium sp.]MDN5910378.1 UDP-N-acetylmuramate dehydrogenase [Brevibacterium sp.]MDN6132749.1 UDP-N-acetylmuramate dehydrogenase [Brevibacterium sp.]